MKIVAKPVDAIAVFKGSGHPRPYKFRLRNADGSGQEVRVDQVISAEERRVAGIQTIVYDCQSTVDGVQKRYQLKYLVRECRWELYKI